MLKIYFDCIFHFSNLYCCPNKYKISFFKFLKIEIQIYFLFSKQDFIIVYSLLIVIQNNVILVHFEFAKFRIQIVSFLKSVSFIIIVVSLFVTAYFYANTFPVQC